MEKSSIKSEVSLFFLFLRQRCKNTLYSPTRRRKMSMTYVYVMPAGAGVPGATTVLGVLGGISGSDLEGCSARPGGFSVAPCFDSAGGGFGSAFPRLLRDSWSFSPFSSESAKFTRAGVEGLDVPLLAGGKSSSAFEVEVTVTVGNKEAAFSAGESGEGAFAAGRGRGGGACARGGEAERRCCEAGC